MKKALITLMAAAFVVAFAMPAAAQTEWGFYGSARVHTFSYDDDWQSGLTPNVPFDDRDTTWGTANNSRFGATAKAGAVSGHIEIRENAEFRIIWGEWDFGFGKLGVGKHYTPANMFYSNQQAYGEAGMLAHGGYYTGADHMIRLRFQGIADMIDFDLAFVEFNSVVRTGVVALADAGTASDLDTTWPQVEGRMLLNFGPVQMEMGGAYVSWDEEIIVGGVEQSYSLDAWAVHFGTKFAMGPFYANGNIHFGENNSCLGQAVADAAVPWYDAVTNTIVDSDRWGWQIAAGFKLNDMISFEAGYGWAEVEYNDPRPFVQGVTFVDNEVATYYFQTVISPAKGVLIIPEIGKRDYKDDAFGVDEGSSFYFGATWKISF